METTLSEIRNYDIARYLFIKSFKDKEIIQDLIAFFNFDNQVASIFTESQNAMVGLLKLQWWETSLEQIHKNPDLNITPIINQLGSIISQDKQHGHRNFQLLRELIDLTKYSVERFTFPSEEDFIENYISKLGQIHSQVASNISGLNFPKEAIAIFEANAAIMFIKYFNIYLEYKWQFIPNLDPGRIRIIIKYLLDFASSSLKIVTLKNIKLKPLNTLYMCCSFLTKEYYKDLRKNSKNDIFIINEPNYGLLMIKIFFNWI